MSISSDFLLSIRGSGTRTNDTRILGKMGMEIPVTKMRGDVMVPHYSFDQSYSINMESKEHWQEHGITMIPEGATTVYTDGSSEPCGTVAGIFFNGLLEDLCIPLGKYTTVFKALHKPRVTSKLTRECIKELNELATNRTVWLTWVPLPGHSGIPGNERADELARQASSQSLVGPEPVLPVSHTVIKTAIRDWVYKQNDKRWRGLTTCRQAKEMISGRCRRRERDLLALPRQILRLVVGVLTGHTHPSRSPSEYNGSKSRPTL